MIFDNYLKLEGIRADEHTVPNSKVIPEVSNGHILGLEGDVT